MLAWLSKNIFFPLWEIKDGAQRQKYLRELCATQWLETEVLQQQQWERVQKIVEYAFTHCPYYRSRYASLGFDGKLRSWQDFRNLPILTKRDIRDNQANLLSEAFRREELVSAKTGG